MHHSKENLHRGERLEGGFRGTRNHNRQGEGGGEWERFRLQSKLGEDENGKVHRHT